MGSKTKWGVFFFVLALIFFGAYWQWKHVRQNVGGTFSSVTLIDNKASDPANALSNPPASQQNVADSEGFISANGQVVYESPDYHFSLKYPKLFTLGSFQNEKGGMTYIFQDKSKTTGAQIVVTPFDENMDMTESRIKEDLPDITVVNPHSVTIGKRLGLAFNSNYASFGKESSNIWFIYNKNLYQMTAPLSASSFLQALFTSLQFK